MAEKQPARGGRPPLARGEGESAQVNIRMAPSTYAAAQARAGAERRSVPDLLRRAVSRYLAEPDDDRD